MKNTYPSAIVWRHIEEIKTSLDKYRKEGETIGFIPTMGSLHSGHMALVEAAKESCDRVVVSIFVNPTQFGEGEDYETYPRNFEADYEILKKHKVDVIFLPDIHDIYDDNAATKVKVLGLDEMLCGKYRTGHFDGVATIVSILFNIIQANINFFGEKDWQQLAIIRAVHRDLHLSGVIQSVKTQRANDGLALSSRNAYLSKRERGIAPKLHQVLKDLSYELNSKHQAIDKAIKVAQKTLELAGFDSIDYLELRHSETLELITDNDLNNARLFVAAYLGKTRLIDNIPLTE